MRTALLSTLELTRDGFSRAFEMLGGRYLIAWQLDLARDLGCSRVICLSASDDQKISEIREIAEQAEMEFQLAGGPLPLVGMLSADQELLVVADGLIIDRDALPAEFGHRPAVLTFPDEAGIAAGFERIDGAHAWAGVLLARANIAVKLAEMPPDSDTISLLLRLALQSGAPLMPVDQQALDAGEWLLVQDGKALAQREKSLLDRSVERASWAAPGIAISRRIARQLAPDGLAHGSAIANAMGAASVLAALALSYAGFTSAGLAVLAAGALGFTTALALARLKARLLGASGARRWEQWAGHVMDAALVLVLALPLASADALDRLFLPLMLLGLVRLTERLAPEHLKQSFGDRALLALGLLVPAWFGVLEQALMGLSLLTIASCLFFQRKTKITRA